MPALFPVKPPEFSSAVITKQTAHMDLTSADACIFKLSNGSNEAGFVLKCRRMGLADAGTAALECSAVRKVLSAACRKKTSELLSAQQWSAYG